MRRCFVTLILKLKRKVWPGNMSLLHLPESCIVAACKAVATVFWDSEQTVQTDYLEHVSTITGTYYTDLIGKC